MRMILSATPPCLVQPIQMASSTPDARTRATGCTFIVRGIIRRCSDVLLMRIRWDSAAEKIFTPTSLTVQQTSAILVATVLFFANLHLLSSQVVQGPALPRQWRQEKAALRYLHWSRVVLLKALAVGPSEH